MGESKKNIIYLKEEKNLICINGSYIDLNLVTKITDNGKSLNLYEINGTKNSFEHQPINFSYKDVPKKYLRKPYKKTEMDMILKGLGSQFSFFRDYDYDLKSIFFLYNKCETDKEKKLILSNWKKLKNDIINKWSGIGYKKTAKVINPKVIKLIKNYYELNNENGDVLESIKKIFGYGLDDIIDTLNLEGDYYVTNDGKIKFI